MNSLTNSRASDYRTGVRDPTDKDWQAECSKSKPWWYDACPHRTSISSWAYSDRLVQLENITGISVLLLVNPIDQHLQWPRRNWSVCVLPQDTICQQHWPDLFPLVDFFLTHSTSLPTGTLYQIWHFFLRVKFDTETTSVPECDVASRPFPCFTWEDKDCSTFFFEKLIAHFLQEFRHLLNSFYTLVVRTSAPNRNSKLHLSIQE